MNRSQVAIVIPCRGENDVTDLIRRASKYGVVIIVDDNAIDGNAMDESAIRNAGARRLVIPAHRRGFSEVYREGIMYAAREGFEYIVEMDAGGSHNPDFIQFLLLTLADGADLATSERFNDGHFVGSWKRRMLSQGGTFLFNWRNGTHLHDATGGFIAYKCETIAYTHGVEFEAEMHWYQSEVRVRALAAGLKIVEVPIVYRSSSSSLNWRGILEASWMLFH